ncbi:unnamed protein product, partial [Rotaria sp. Silwood1]
KNKMNYTETSSLSKSNLKNLAESS